MPSSRRGAQAGKNCNAVESGFSRTSTPPVESGFSRTSTPCIVRPMGVTRRTFVAAGASWLALTAVGATRQAPTKARLVLLGTAGGPTPKAKSAAPAQAIVVGDRIYLIDAGDGVARQLALARLPIRQLRALFITHQHSDHNAGYGPLFLLGWAAGLSAPVDVYGPPPLKAMTTHLIDAHGYDIELRRRDEGREPLAPLFRPHEITKAGRVFEDDRVRVTAALNDHPPIEHSFAFRFDTADRSIVISGDTRYSENVIALAKGADVLVHEVVSREFWERPDAPQTPAVVRHILASHTDAVDVGRVAAAAGVRTLVLSHFVPTEGPGAPTDEQWLAAARRHFKGEVIIGRDLMEI
jgi:ribonuclease BN (tRNA processing enzyme)